RLRRRVDAAATARQRATATVAAGGGGKKRRLCRGGLPAPGRAPERAAAVCQTRPTCWRHRRSPLTEATSEAGDAPAGDETPKSPIDPQHQKSKASDGGRTERGGAGASSGAGQGAPPTVGWRGRFAVELAACGRRSSKTASTRQQRPTAAVRAAAGSQDTAVHRRRPSGGCWPFKFRQKKSVALGGSSGCWPRPAPPQPLATAEADDDLRARPPETRRQPGCPAGRLEVEARTQAPVRAGVASPRMGGQGLSDEEKKALD
uniref:Homeobox domain-containing protein n=1 Tax=Macrostomum lignano TaxID=282301 RepID=A0A1I8FGU5_9PLAT